MRKGGPWAAIHEGGGGMRRQPAAAGVVVQRPAPASCCMGFLRRRQPPTCMSSLPTAVLPVNPILRTCSRWREGWVGCRCVCVCVGGGGAATKARQAAGSRRWVAGRAHPCGRPPTAQHSTARHSTAKHSAARHSTARQPAHRLALDQRLPNGLGISSQDVEHAARHPCPLRQPCQRKGCIMCGAGWWGGAEGCCRGRVGRTAHVGGGEGSGWWAW